ncbi:hypothetical protein PP504_gp64 [Gordonia phage Dolores]|uniref:Uncharacterized protein n=2 Tax=Beenievirus TaxID=3044673 RepID=A0A514DIF9_9CAUD|nr:hypothetical protein PP503_gp63 [Gordonia phage Sekhmet]YP_010654231.1 hypothetical protein PP504_gp64 [Gordonia phage Dolores]QDH93401.1 hypothetical protein SEA_SEKHMET_63 [Gordonia phage Sekhmet]UAJ16495.1 hypothetical protein SEA_DOLORES_64 [Gordonia phage Dolores]URM87980.1 hypothetical protein SEA_WINKNICK_64 [Gordonia phage WinkNick]
MTYIRNTLIPAVFNEDIGVRNRCSNDRHEPVTYNPIHGFTFCRCGLITRPGDLGRHPTDQEACDAAHGRRDHHLVCPLHRGDR